MEALVIQGTAIRVKEYRGKRVVTFRDIDTVHQRPEGTARRNFADNRQRFVNGVDFFKISMDEFRTLDIVGNYNYPKGVTLITESGYLMLVKSFTDDLAWKVQRELVDTYFRFREEKREEAETVTASMVEPGDLIRCAEIMAGCLEGNRGYVLNILRNVIPDIDGGTAPVQADDTAVVDAPEKASADGRNTSYRMPFNYRKFDEYLRENHISNVELEQMVGASGGCAVKWRSGRNTPIEHFRKLICIKLDLPDGYFNGRVRRTRNER